MTQETQRVVIIGGGIAGLSTAWYIEQAASAPLHITLIEQTAHLGGKVRTDQILVDGATLVIEGGPDSFIIQKPWAAQLCRELGLEDQFIATQELPQKVYVLHKGRPLPLPEGVMLMVPTNIGAFLASPLVSWFGKLRMGLDLVLPARRNHADETLASFVRRRFGAEALDKIAEPLMAGIYNAESDRQSLQATFPRFLELEQKYGSLVRGMRKSRAQQPRPSNQPTSPFLALRGGMQTLIDTLQARLKATLHTTTKATAITPDSTTGSYTVQLHDGSTLQADLLVLAIPAYAAADLVAPWATELAQGLRQIRYVSTGTISLAYRRSEVDLPLDGYGLVIPNSEKRRINACTITSRKFRDRAPDEYVLLRVFFGGSRHPEVFALDDDRVYDLVRAELHTIFGLKAQPVWHGIYRWPAANPQYDVGHLQHVAALEALCPAGMWLTGSAYRGVGLPDCIHQAQQTAAKVIAHAAQQLKTPAIH